MQKLKYFITVLVFGAFSIAPLSAFANCNSCNPCRNESRTQTNESIEQIKEHVDDEFEAHRVWWISIFWEDNLLPAWMLMTEQLTTVAMKQTEIFGGFLDAKHQMETQQLFSELRAQAHKDYHPSVGMCEFGSNVKSLAASERQGEIAAVVLSQRAQDRALGNANTEAAEGPASDAKSRLKQYREVYCDPKDNNDGMQFMCDHEQPADGEGQIGGSDKKRMNKDIDYVRTVEFPWTLKVNLTDADLQDDEEDVLALAANLYGREVFNRPGAGDLQDQEGIDMKPLQLAYMDARAILAKRSVAENSFNAIVGMKAEGTAGSRDFLKGILKELGVADDSGGGGGSGGDTEMDKLISENPSYYAQMEVLTKKIYQNPDFYTNLYDKPVNVERKGVALQAIGLMQKFDLFKSYLRNEASMSVLLELAVIDLQEEIENNMAQQAPGGEAAGGN